MTMKEKGEPTSDAVEILDRRYYQGDPERAASLEEERANAGVARVVYDLRTSAGLTQSQLAHVAGTTVTVIAQLEDADYEGHALAMLHRIADGLGRRVEIHLAPAEEEVTA
jgi:DNA-binding XRE family transcriptional regulator